MSQTILGALRMVYIYLARRLTSKPFVSSTPLDHPAPLADEDDNVVNRDPVIFPSIEERVRGTGPIMLCLLDGPPNPSVDQIVRRQRWARRFKFTVFPSETVSDGNNGGETVLLR